uniref:RNase H type-1 domain-containing protein n=1 Tax=Quercus lobata TaxID=97700 RepID=A0A7N2LNM0_QUELO
MYKKWFIKPTVLKRKVPLIRDHAGTVIAALSQHLHLPLGPLEAEAKAMDVAVSFAWDVGVQEVIFETDFHCSVGLHHSTSYSD